MFPIRWNKAFRKKDGSISTIGAEIDAGGGGGGGGTVTPDYENNVLDCGTSNDYRYYVPMSREYIGTGISGYEIKTNPESSQVVAKIDIYSIIYSGSEVVSSTFIKTLVHNGDKTYTDENISVNYDSITTTWNVTLLTSMYKEDGTTWTSPISWLYSDTVDQILLESSPV